MSIVFLCHCNGSNGSAVFVDEAGNSITAHGAAQLTTSNALFGTACALFSGANTCYISVATGMVIQNNATFEFSVRPTAYNVNWSTVVKIRDSGDIFTISVSDDGSLYLNNLLMAGAGAVPLNVYTNIRVVRYLGELLIFKNGVFINALSFATGNHTPSTIQFGSWGETAPGDGLIGTIDEIMIDDSVAWNTTHDSYTIPAAPFSTLSTTAIEHILLCQLLPDITSQTIEHNLPCPIFAQQSTEQTLSCPLVSTTMVEHNLPCPIFLAEFIEHQLKINDVFHSEHALSVGSWSVSYIEHSLPILMTTTMLIEQQLSCPIDAINPTTHLEHVLIIPMLNSNSIVINVHIPETPLHGTYS